MLIIKKHQNSIYEAEIRKIRLSCNHMEYSFQCILLTCFHTCIITLFKDKNETVQINLNFSPGVAFRVLKHNLSIR